MPLNFQDPPKDKRISHWSEILKELRQNPGRWALVEEGSSAPYVAGNIRRGVYKGSVPGEFEATARSREVEGQKVFDIYARYPEKSE